jgi:hypothetical protein
MKTSRLATGIALLLLAGCASYDGRGLVPGQSTANDVQALMGTPADRLTAPNGDTVLYYPRGPAGMHTYAVHVSPGGVMRSIDQLLTVENLKKLVPGATTTAQVRADFGPPGRITRLDRQQRDVWEYRMRGADQDPYYLYVQLSGDGIVREVLFLKDYNSEPGGPGKD